MNDSDYQLPLCDIDPDLCFFNELEFQVSSNCNYFNCESFVNAHNDKQKRYCYDNLSLCHVNIRILKQNFAGLERYLGLLNMKFTIIGVTETWLDEYDCDLYGLNVYNLVEKHRDSRRGGGVGIFIRNGACYSERNIIVCVIYRPPNTDTLVFIELFNDILDIIKREDKLCYILSDFNIYILNYDAHSATAQFMDTLYENAFFPLTNRPTRVTPTSATLIDNIFTNNLHSYEYVLQGVFVTDISDHFPVFHINYLYKGKEIESYTCKTNYSLRNKQNFRVALAEIDWNKLHAARDAQQAFTMFHSIFLKLYNEHFPKRRVKTKYNNRKPWLSQGLKLSIRTKNKLYLTYVKLKCLRNELSYKSYRNKLNHTSRLLKGITTLNC